eukprot:2657438-Rhodomonas_salina.1
MRLSESLLLSADDCKNARTALKQPRDWGLIFRVTMMLIGCIATAWTVCAVTTGVVKMALTATSLFASSLAFLQMTYPHPDTPNLTTTDVRMALSAMTCNIAHEDVFFLDSCASYTIIRNKSVLSDIRFINPVTIEGLTGPQ